MTVLLRLEERGVLFKELDAATQDLSVDRDRIREPSEVRNARRGDLAQRAYESRRDMHPPQPGERPCGRSARRERRSRAVIVRCANDLQLRRK